MGSVCKYSDEIKEYLCRFYEILDNMIEGMNDAQLNASISHSFIVQMIPHHKAAVEMSENLLKYSGCVPLRCIASGIITEQTQSIHDMERVLPCCDNVKNTKRDLYLYTRQYKQITQAMFAGMRNAPACSDVNTSFMKEMIPHHEGAVHMSENALRYDICPELFSILTSIIRSQKRGIAQMKNLLRCR